MNKNEQSLQTALCRYMKLQYPNIPFKVDHGANQNKTSFIEQQIYKKQQYKRGFPDFAIFKPTTHYSGLFLELKQSYDTLFTKKGLCRRGAENHHVEQHDFLQELNGLNYCARFAWDLDMAKVIIDKYIAGFKIPTQDIIFGDEKANDADLFLTSMGL